VILLSLFVTRNLRDMCLSVELLKGYMIRERLETPEVDSGSQTFRSSGPRLSLTGEY